MTISPEHADRLRRAPDAGGGDRLPGGVGAEAGPADATAPGGAPEEGFARRLSQRSVRSFVVRAGRTTEAQRRALAELRPRFAVPFGDNWLDLDGVFGRQAPKILEIGFGMGETTAAIAAAHPEHDYLGVEVHAPGVGALLQRIAAMSLANLRLIQHDAHEVLERMIPPHSLAGVHVFFPDPWPKKRHHKRRLIQPPLVALIASRLAPGGYLHCATDWSEYAESMLAVLSAEGALRNAADGFATRPGDRPLTKFERRGLRLGHAVRDLVFHRR